MTLNFDLKKPWTDLAESKPNIKYLILIGLLMIVLGVIDLALKTKTFSSIGNIILGGYFILMINNIIHDKKPILEDLSNSSGSERNLFFIILKIFGIGIVYGLAMITIGIILFLIFLKGLMLDMRISVIALIVFLLPLLILLSLSNLLFAENLKFSDAFNIKKAVKSFSIAWKEYLIAFILNILLVVLAILLLIIIAIPLGIIVALVFKLMTFIPDIILISKFVGGIFGIVIGELGAIIISYWYLNILAQAYKYSLTKMNITVNE